MDGGQLGLIVTDDEEDCFLKPFVERNAMITVNYIDPPSSRDGDFPFCEYCLRAVSASTVEECIALGKELADMVGCAHFALVIGYRNLRGQAWPAAKSAGGYGWDQMVYNTDANACLHAQVMDGVLLSDAESD